MRTSVVCGLGGCDVDVGSEEGLREGVGGEEEDGAEEEKNDGWRCVIGLEGGEGESLSFMPEVRGFEWVEVVEENGGSSMFDVEGLQIVKVSWRDLMVSMRATSVMRLFSSRGS